MDVIQSADDERHRLRRHDQLREHHERLGLHRRQQIRDWVDLITARRDRQERAQERDVIIIRGESHRHERIGTGGHSALRCATVAEQSSELGRALSCHETSVSDAPAASIRHTIPHLARG